VAEHPKIDARLAGLAPGDSVAICTVVLGEILFGIERLPPGKRRDNLKAKTDTVLSGFPCHAIVEDIASQYAATKRACERKGTPLDENDLWIAATALKLRAILVTRDTDFKQVAGLSIEDWTI
jgi:predicted nucleic acid-binding protein